MRQAHTPPKRHVMRLSYGSTYEARERAKSTLTPELLGRLLVEEGLSTHQASRVLGITSTTIATYADKFGIPRKRYKEPQEEGYPQEESVIPPGPYLTLDDLSKVKASLSIGDKVKCQVTDIPLHGDTPLTGRLIVSGVIVGLHDNVFEVHFGKYVECFPYVSIIMREVRVIDKAIF